MNFKNNATYSTKNGVTEEYVKSESIPQVVLPLNTQTKIGEELCEAIDALVDVTMH